MFFFFFFLFFLRKGHGSGEVKTAEDNANPNNITLPGQKKKNINPKKLAL